MGENIKVINIKFFNYFKVIKNFENKKGRYVQMLALGYLYFNYYLKDICLCFNI